MYNGSVSIAPTSIDCDSDGDGIKDSNDPFPLNAAPLEDSDGDGIDDGADAFPFDAAETLDTDADGTGNNADTDDDGDGIADESDSYPLISLGSLTDTDGDGRPNDCDNSCTASGMAADTDDDNDGVTDEQELIDGTNPLDALSCSGCYSVFDVDADGEVKPLTDGLLLIRYFFGLTGDALVRGAVNGDGYRTSAEEIETYLESHMP